jgi:hypothetical protein
MAKMAAASCELEKRFCEFAGTFRDNAKPFRQFTKGRFYFAKSFCQLAQRRGTGAFLPRPLIFPSGTDVR